MELLKKNCFKLKNYEKVKILKIKFFFLKKKINKWTKDLCEPICFK